MINMLHKLIPQLRAQVRPHLSGEEQARGTHVERAPALRGAPSREAREHRRGGRGGGGGVFEGALKAGGGVDEAVGKAWV